MTDFIPYGRQLIEDDDVAAVVQALRGAHLTTGPRVPEFEAALAAETGAKYAVAVATGTAALHIAAMAMGVGPGDEVLVPPLTFAASANCVLYCGGTPVFVDIDPATMLMDLTDAEKKLTPRTKAILPVHYGGECCDMDAIEAFAGKHGLMILQDAAHSLGTLCRGKKLGSYPGMQIWSFHPVKTITTGEGGAVTTNDEALYKALLRLRTHGITRDTSQYAREDEGGWYYEMLDLGYNYRITDFQCALGVSQMKKLPRFAARRAEIVARYNEAFRELPLLVQQTPEWSEPVRHLYTIRLKDSSRRREVFDALRAKQIGVNVHYLPVYRLPYYEKLGYPRGLCPQAERAYEAMVTIPLHPAMTEDEVGYVIQCVKEAVL